MSNGSLARCQLPQIFSHVVFFNLISGLWRTAWQAKHDQACQLSLWPVYQFSTTTTTTKVTWDILLWIEKVFLGHLHQVRFKLRSIRAKLFFGRCPETLDCEIGPDSSFDKIWQNVTKSGARRQDKLSIVLVTSENLNLHMGSKERERGRKREGEI